LTTLLDGSRSMSCSSLFPSFHLYMPKYGQLEGFHSDLLGSSFRADETLSQLPRLVFSRQELPCLSFVRTQNEPFRQNSEIESDRLRVASQAFSRSSRFVNVFWIRADSVNTVFLFRTEQRNRYDTSIMISSGSYPYTDYHRTFSNNLPAAYVHHRWISRLLCFSVESLSARRLIL
jgi:hypothetical protein